MGTPDNSSANIGTPAFDAAAVSSWIDLVHGNSEGLIHICSVGNWEGRTFTEASDAAAYVQRLDREGAQGIYMRTTTLSRVPKSGERGGDEMSKMLPGFAADMDIAGPGHKPVKGILPPDLATCVTILDAARLPEPTLWVFSGGGYYPWWMLEDSLDLTTPEALEWARDMSSKLHQVIADVAADLGWFYSAATKDMSRVLRIPGTVNRKVKDDPKLCQVLQPASYGFYSIEFLKDKIDEAYANRPIPAEMEPPRPAPVVRTEGSPLRPGDDFNDRAHWADILTPHGWTYMYHRGQTWYWRRPGKDSGEHSATTGRKGMGSEDRLYVFSDATGFDPNVPYSKHAAYTLLNYGSVGSSAFAQSTRDLRAQGYGGELPTLP